MTDQPPPSPPEPYAAPGASPPNYPQPNDPQPNYPQPSAPSGYGQFAPPAPPTWQPPAQAPTKRPRRMLIAAVAGAVVVVGAGIAVGVTLLTSSSSTSQATYCKNASAGASVISQVLPNATAKVTPGGSPLSAVPALPAGKNAGCTLTITTHDVTVTGYMAIYSKPSDANGYRAVLLRDGYTQPDGTQASATATGPLVSPDGNTLVLILSTTGKTVVEELSAPPGSGG